MGKSKLESEEMLRTATRKFVSPKLDNGWKSRHHIFRREQSINERQGRDYPRDPKHLQLHMTVLSLSNRFS